MLFTLVFFLPRFFTPGFCFARVFFFARFFGPGFMLPHFSISICLSVDNKGHSEENLSKILDPYMLTSRS